MYQGHKTYFKIPTWRSPAYLKFIRSKPCLEASENCDGDIQAHHEAFGNRGTGTKAPDSYTVPLCCYHHQLRERIGKKGFWQGLLPELPRIMLEYVTEFLATKE